MKGQRRRLSIGGATIWFAFSYGGAILGYLAINALAGRLLGAASFGYFVVAVTVSTVLGQLGLLGVHRGGLREAARLEPDDLEGLRDLRRSVRGVSMVALPLTAIATSAVTFVILDGVGVGTRSAIALGMGFLVWLGGQQKLWANYLRGFGDIRFASLLEGRSGGALTSLAQGALMGAVLVFFSSWGLAGALGALAMGYAVPIMLAWLRVWRRWRHVEVARRPFADLRMAVSRHWRFASNLLGGYLNGTVEVWIAALILAAADLSLFAAAQRLSVLLVVPLTSLGVVFSPVVARLFDNDDRLLERLLRTGATLAAAATMVVWLPLLLVPGPVLTVALGDDVFAAAAPILLILTIGSMSNVLSGMCGTALTMSRHEGVATTVQWVAVIVRIGSGVIAAHLFGGVGLAASAAAVTAVMYATLWLLTRRRMGMWTHLTLRPNLRLMRQTSG